MIFDPEQVQQADEAATRESRSRSSFVVRVDIRDCESSMGRVVVNAARRKRKRGKGEKGGRGSDVSARVSFLRFLRHVMRSPRDDYVLLRPVITIVITATLSFTI